MDRTALVMDGEVRRHLGLMLVVAQSGEDTDVARLGRQEMHRLVGAVIAGLRSHLLDDTGCCVACRDHQCKLRAEMCTALLPVRDGAGGSASPKLAHPRRS